MRYYLAQIPQDITPCAASCYRLHAAIKSIFFTFLPSLGQSIYIFMYRTSYNSMSSYLRSLRI